MGNIDTSVAGVEKCSAVDEALSLFYLYIQDTYSSKDVELICNELKAIADERTLCVISLIQPSVPTHKFKMLFQK